MDGTNSHGRTRMVANWLFCLLQMKTWEDGDAFIHEHNMWCPYGKGGSGSHFWGCRVPAPEQPFLRNEFLLAEVARRPKWYQVDLLIGSPTCWVRVPGILLMGKFEGVLETQITLWRPISQWILIGFHPSWNPSYILCWAILWRMDVFQICSQRSVCFTLPVCLHRGKTVLCQDLAGLGRILPFVK